MSRDIGLRTIRLEPVSRIAHVEYSADFPAMIKAVTGVFSNDREDTRRFFDAWDYDVLALANDGPVPWSERGRVTGKLTFCGNIDVRILASNDRDAVDEELERKILPVLQAGTGYILHSDHSIPPDVEYDALRYFLNHWRKTAERVYGRTCRANCRRP